MGFYDLTREQRMQLLRQIEEEIMNDLCSKRSDHIIRYASDEDTYIRKAVYLALGKIYFTYTNLQTITLNTLSTLFNNPSEKVRQTAINALGEVGKKDGDKVLPLFEKALFDSHHSVRNAVIGSLKKMGEVNPLPILSFSKKYLHHLNPEVRRQALHGIELRGRTYPEDILPLLEEMQFEQNRRVKKMVIHVIGQISYKKGCLEKVIAALRRWKNKTLVQQAVAEILQTHKAYEKFSAKSYKEASEYIKRCFQI